MKVGELIVKPKVVVCVDWSKHFQKRVAWVAYTDKPKIERLSQRRWTVSSLVQKCRELDDRGILLAFDAPIGVPKSYFTLAQSFSPSPASNFMKWLPIACAKNKFFSPVAKPEDWSVEAPFFRIPAGKGSLRAFERAARDKGVELKRRIEILNSGKSVFAMGIPGLVSPAAQALWQEIVEAKSNGISFSTWPFDGSLFDLLAAPGVTITEIYPRTAYGVALGNRVANLSKGKSEARHQVINKILGMPWVLQNRLLIKDLTWASAGEDDFDAMMSAAALLRRVLEHEPLADPHHVDPEAEGGILST